MFYFLFTGKIKDIQNEFSTALQCVDSKVRKLKWTRKFLDICITTCVTTESTNPNPVGLFQNKMHLSEAFGQRCNSESTQVHIPVYRLNCLFFPEIIDGAVSLNILTQCFFTVFSWCRIRYFFGISGLSGVLKIIRMRWNLSLKWVTLIFQ